MKKFGVVFVILLLIALGGFFWLLSESSNAHAPQEPVTIDLPDSFEK